ncbi:xanthine dehydrogenase small subunit [Pseudoalteromonas denitrificans]|uniref:Xanthine dehydrogenase small subunit n=1 Tax=Pseudoalteromonas denitrificans DSM 6059 TaxID=1123010 RepID=A0A1I1L5Y9_9GAMM|nr:xanthine dehydrogenase small subunit [Pseudoalteromonas denitrificans]SFC68467.1 xanthine dehydrogenase small subunit [Pseudoalteromonas denitrificans DSM 6059]
MLKNKIQFLLNDRLISLSDINPNTSILQYLRSCTGKSGTKEGCASGDCGACTVVTVEYAGGDLRYKSLNACISLLPSLHGKQLLTVEDLQDGDKLHPVQKAMVDFHGSQCGFCTPGFIMSLFALHKNNPEPEKAQTLEALAGNLCRCTGYRAIIDAASAAKNHGPDQFDRNKRNTIAALAKIQKTSLLKLSEGDQVAYSPSSLSELTDLMLAHPNARIIAGGTDIVLEITQMMKSLGTIIYVGNVPELQEFEESDAQFTLGAALPFSDFTPSIATHYHEFGEMIERIGSLQIRNQGTLGGNIGNASPIADTPPVLIALDAKLNLRLGNKNRIISIEDYFIDYKKTSQQKSEFIQSIIIPKAKENSYLKVYKISKRFDDDISAVLAAFNLVIEDDVVKSVRIAFGGMAGTPKRAIKCEKELIGKPWTQASIENGMQALEQDFTPMSDVRASANYRMVVAKNLLQKAFIEITQPTINTGVVQYA